MIYPSEALISSIYQELVGSDKPLDTPKFRQSFLNDAVAASRFIIAHEAAEAADGRVGGSLVEAETLILLWIEDLINTHTDRNLVSPPVLDLNNVKRLAPALELIESDLSSDLSLDALAQAVGIGRFHFLRLFKTSLGAPPHAYIMQIRIARAKALLDGCASVGDVALATGFFDQSHFANAFRHAYGMTPRDYQRGIARNSQSERTNTFRSNDIRNK